MNNVVISGYFGFNNAGDELLLESLVQIIETQNPKVKITVIGRAKNADKNIHYIYRNNFIDICKAFSGSDTVIYTGGLYQDTTSSLSLYYYLFQLILAKMFGNTVILQGVDFGPVKHKFNKFMLQAVLKFADKIILRTKGSLEYLNNHKNITLDKDIVFYNKTPAKMKFHNPAQNKKTGIILRKTKNIANNEIIQFINKLAEAGSNPEIILIPFQLEEDFIYSIEIANQINYNNINISRWIKPGDLFYIISGLDIVISQRLHGLIIGSILDKPVYAVSQDPKIRYFMADINQSGRLFQNFENMEHCQKTNKML